MTKAGVNPPVAGLGRLAARGMAATLIGQVIRVSAQIAGVVILARLLEPSDFGYLAMAASIVGVGELLRDFGLSSAAIQSRTLTRSERDNLFWINTAVGALVGALAVVFAVPIASLYGSEPVASIVRLLAITFLMNGVATQYLAQLSRQLRFKALAVADTVGPVTGLALGGVMAACGYGYGALVFQMIAASAGTMMAAVLVSRWAPRWYDRSTNMKRFLHFGGNVLGVQLIAYVSRNVDSLILGITVGARQLGLYDRAFQLLMLPLNQINAPSMKLALPLLSKVQDERARFNLYLLRGQSALVNIVVCCIAFVAAGANQVIHLCLGANWAESAPIFQLLAIGGIAQVVSYATYWTFMAKGLTRSNLFYALVTRPLVVGSVLVGAFAGGSLGVAIGYAVSLLILWPIGLYWIWRVANVPSLSMFFNGLRAIAVYGACSAACWCLNNFFTTSPGVDLLLNGAIFLSVIAITGAVWPGYRRDLFGVAGIIGTAIRRN